MHAVEVEEIDSSDEEFLGGAHSGARRVRHGALAAAPDAPRVDEEAEAAARTQAVAEAAAAAERRRRREAMRAAHPDRGGTAEEFLRARGLAGDEAAGWDAEAEAMPAALAADAYWNDGTANGHAEPRDVWRSDDETLAAGAAGGAGAAAALPDMAPEVRRSLSAEAASLLLGALSNGAASMPEDKVAEGSKSGGAGAAEGIGIGAGGLDERWSGTPGEASVVSDVLRYLERTGEDGGAVTAGVVSREGLRRRLHEILGVHESGDVVIKAGAGRRIRAHRLVLAARSEFFRAMFKADMAEARSGVIDMQSYPARIVTALLHFMYTGDAAEACGISEDVVELAILADAHGLVDLVDWIAREAVGRLGVDNVADLLALAGAIGHDYLRTKAMEFASEHQEALVKASGWERLPPDVRGELSLISRAMAENPVGRGLPVSCMREMLGIVKESLTEQRYRLREGREQLRDAIARGELRPSGAAKHKALLDRQEARMAATQLYLDRQKAAYEAMLSDPADEPAEG